MSRKSSKSINCFFKKEKITENYSDKVLVSQPNVPYPFIVFKPVILFYNYDHNIELQVNLTLNSSVWQFSDYYPQSDYFNSRRTKLTWNIKIEKNKNYSNNILKITQSKDNRKFSYLYWEAENREEN